MKRSLFAVGVAVVVMFLTAFSLCVGALRSSLPVFAAEDRYCIVIDAGHGGIDGGVSGRKTGVKERDLNLSISFCLKEILTDAGFSVVMTRKTEAGLYDTTLRGFKKRDMQKRKQIIEAAKPTAVISIHQNFYPSSLTRGAQAFYLAASPKSKLLGERIQQYLNSVYASVGVKSRSATAGNYYMLECTEYPSVIVECGFLSNAEDERLLNTEGWQKRLAEGIAAGVLAYLEELSVLST